MTTAPGSVETRCRSCSSQARLECPPESVPADGEAVWEISAPQERLSELGEQLEAFGIPFDLVSIHQSIDTESLLTDDQYDLLETAVSEGYYDTPRTCTLTELAEAVGLAKSTTSEKLHRAEGKVMKRSFRPPGAGRTRRA